MALAAPFVSFSVADDVAATALTATPGRLTSTSDGSCCEGGSPGTADPVGDGSATGVGAAGVSSSGSGVDTDTTGGASPVTAAALSEDSLLPPPHAVNSASATIRKVSAGRYPGRPARMASFMIR